MSTPIRVVVVEDHHMMREGLIEVLQTAPDIEIVGACDSLAATLDAAESENPTVIVADQHLTDGLGSTLPTLLKARGSTCPVLLMSGFDRPQTLQDAIDGTCAGFVSKRARGVELIAAIRTVSIGGTVYPAQAIARFVRGEESRARRKLTGRELEVLTLLASAEPIPAISERLGISIHTARNHVKSILTKLHARSQLEAVVTAVSEGIVNLP